MAIVFGSYYTIGKMHWYCEDYAMQGREPFPHVILADGCSASLNSDVGARLLVLNARQEIERFARVSGDEAERTALHWRLGRRIARRAARQIQALRLPPETLDATLLVSWCDGAKVFVHLYGDGCIATRRADGSVAVIQVEYAENAPYYLSYLLDTERQAFYQEAIGDLAVAQSVRYLNETTDSSIRREQFNAPIMFSFDLATFPTIAVATDGLHSFINAETSNWVNSLEVTRAMLDFGSYEGAFVRDRLEKVLIEFGKRSIFNLDDLSLGVFVERG